MIISYYDRCFIHKNNRTTSYDTKKKIKLYALYMFWVCSLLMDANNTYIFEFFFIDNQQKTLY